MGNCCPQVYQPAPPQSPPNHFVIQRMETAAPPPSSSSSSQSPHSPPNLQKESSSPLEVSPLTPSPPMPSLPAFPSGDGQGVGTIINLSFVPPSSASLAPQPTPTFPVPPAVPVQANAKLRHSKSAPNFAQVIIQAPRLSERRLAQRFFVYEQGSNTSGSNTSDSYWALYYASNAAQPRAPPRSPASSASSSSTSSSSVTPSTHRGTDTRFRQQHRRIYNLPQPHHHHLQPPPSGAKSAR